MGLDMYLRKKKVSDVGYWRKANQIHNWFAKHAPNGDLDDLEEMPVTKEMLTELLETCRKVRADHKLAPELLPSTKGFFFGSTDYDDWYFEDIDETIRMISEILETTDFDEEQLYYFAWW